MYLTPPPPDHPPPHNNNKVSIWKRDAGMSDPFLVLSVFYIPSGGTFDESLQFRPFLGFLGRPNFQLIVVFSPGQVNRGSCRIRFLRPTGIFLIFFSCRRFACLVNRCSDCHSHHLYLFFSQVFLRGKDYPLSLFAIARPFFFSRARLEDI